MINIYKTNDEKKLVEINKIEKNTWIDLNEPTEEELKLITDKTGIPYSLIYKMLDEEEVARVEKEDDATLIVIDAPIMEDRKIKNKFSTIPLGIITCGDFVVTITKIDPEVFNEFKEDRVKGFDTSKKTRFIIQLLQRVSSLYIKYLGIINYDMDMKEKTIAKATSNKQLLGMMHLQKSLVYFVTSLKANDIILEKLAKGNIIKLFDEDRDILEDAIIESKQGIETASIYREIVASMSETYAGIISNNLNEIMKFLAGITIVFSIPTMVSSFMGMNVPLGMFQESDFSFLFLVVLSLALSIIIAVILKKKDML